jgi:hypothetical protein
MVTKSKQRVRDHGEVFTQEREVNAMLDLVKNETERIESRFLEPACGDGNFLAPILERKLAIVKKRYSKSQTEFERMLLLAIGSLYGVELLQDNVEACIKRLYKIVDDAYTKLYKEQCKNDFRKSVQFVLSRNILQGDALTLKKTNGKEYIVFSEWALVNGSKIKRRDFTFEELIKKESAGEGPLFELLDKDRDPYLIPQPIKEFPLMHYLNLDYEDAK